ncbi:MULTISPECIES: type II toxin-antitoxin system VapB family antitoxin [Protofrankia]|uniref:Uncharacterized protein n=1 Tax=Candidatus Protofrankia datiscae TaxID=2716812 RepID=F8B536_9ACTN|nr:MULTISPECIES: type II toxin-antitoxin system VapB family antitoxin [Protofrankia]AEH11058.1 Protein of unknown function DUF2191 [Candidatus Protofrankia datiscae]
MILKDVRASIAVDDELIEEAMRLFGVNTRREIVDLALRHLIGRADFRRRALAMEGTGWDTDMTELRPDFVPSSASVLLVQDQTAMREPGRKLGPRSPNNTAS